MGLRDYLGSKVSNLGTALHLPEYGISEAISGGRSSADNLAGGYSIPGSTYGPAPVQQQVGDLNGPFQSDLMNPLDTGGTSGGSGAAYTPNMVVFKGIQYDLNNPDDRNAFIGVQSAEVDKNLTSALKSGNLSYAAKLLEYKHNFEAEGQKLGQDYSTGMANRQQYYAGLGTRAYQSSGGSSAKFALDTLGKAQNERNYQKDQFNSGLEQEYNNWIQGAQANAQTQKDTMTNQVANIGGFDTSKINGSMADLSQYSPIINFQQLAASPMATGAGKVMAPQQQMTLSQYLQQNQAQNQDPNYLANYLMGK